MRHFILTGMKKAIAWTLAVLILGFLFIPGLIAGIYIGTRMMNFWAGAFLFLMAWIVLSEAVIMIRQHRGR